MNFQKCISSWGEERPVWIRGAVDALSTDMFKASLDWALSNLI